MCNSEEIIEIKETYIKEIYEEEEIVKNFSPTSLFNSYDLELAIKLQEKFDNKLGEKKNNKEPFCSEKNSEFSSQEDKDYAFALILQEKYDKKLNSRSKKEDLKKKGNTFQLNQEDKDFALALKLQEEINKEIDKLGDCSYVGLEGNLSDPSHELLDPNPSITELFVALDKKYFWKSLGRCEVIWSKRMTSCAGTCTYYMREGRFCIIRLSEPLLKLRPRKNLLETLLHEMIHAYLFLTNTKDNEGHGDEFKKHMRRINQQTGLHLTIYHSFIDEVDHYKTHWWQCDGPCKNKPPYFGLVKRSTNRAPSSNDFWWKEHQISCGGNFNKIRSPPKQTSASSSSSSSQGTKPSASSSSQGTPKTQSNTIPQYFEKSSEPINLTGEDFNSISCNNDDNFDFFNSNTKIIDDCENFNDINKNGVVKRKIKIIERCSINIKNKKT